MGERAYGAPIRSDDDDTDYSRGRPQPGPADAETRRRKIREALKSPSKSSSPYSSKSKDSRSGYTKPDARRVPLGTGKADRAKRAVSGRQRQIDRAVDEATGTKRKKDD